MTGADFRGTNHYVALDSRELDLLIQHHSSGWVRALLPGDREQHKKRYEWLLAMKTGITVDEAA